MTVPGAAFRTLAASAFLRKASHPARNWIILRPPCSEETQAIYIQRPRGLEQGFAHMSESFSALSAQPGNLQNHEKKKSFFFNSLGFEVFHYTAMDNWMFKSRRDKGKICSNIPQRFTNNQEFATLCVRKIWKDF